LIRADNSIPDIYNSSLELVEASRLVVVQSSVIGVLPRAGRRPIAGLYPPAPAASHSRPYKR